MKCLPISFNQSGKEDDVSNEFYELSEQFVCTLYGRKEDHDVNDVRCKMYCAKRGKCEANQLPPCKSSLRKHVQRANYQCRIWRETLTPMVNIPDPVTHGWEVGDDGSLEIDWMDYQPAPDEVFLNENVNQCKGRWVMIVLFISYKQILDFSHIVNFIVRAWLHIKTCYVVGEFSQMSYFFGGGEGCKLNGNGRVHGNLIF